MLLGSHLDSVPRGVPAVEEELELGRCPPPVHGRSEHPDIAVPHSVEQVVHVVSLDTDAGVGTCIAGMTRPDRAAAKIDLIRHSIVLSGTAQYLVDKNIGVPTNSGTADEC